jgi:hypothetical protein
MKTLFLTIFSLTTSIIARADTDCIWRSHKAGITINYVAPCTFENQSVADSVLRLILAELNRKDTSLKIFVLVNHMQLSFLNGNYSNFFSIGFDTLRYIDDDYIFNYYSNQESVSMSIHGGLNTYRSQEAPLDINSTNDRKAIEVVGIKIFYEIDYRLGKPDWTELIKAILYASKHPDLIKTEQRRDTVRYNINGWYVSLLTIDTFAINKIAGRESQFKKDEIPYEKPKSKNNYWLFGLLSLLILGTLGYWVWQQTR